jgi:magnesium-transporting ATPase (P-type)
MSETGVATLAAPGARGTAAAVAEPYAQEADAVLADVNSSPAGLSSQEAAVRLGRDGPNLLPVGKPDPALVRFFKHFDDILIYILLAAAALKAILAEWVDFGVILVAAIINATIGFIQEGRAEQALRGIRAMLSDQAQVRRDGEWSHVEAAQLVVGDIVRVGPGARVPADLRLIEAHNLRVEEAPLTGEAVPSAKSTEPVEVGTSLGDRTSMLYSSCLVSAGSGIGVVTATGSGAEIGRITTMLADVDAFDTPLTRQLARFGKSLALLIAGMVIAMALIGKLVHDMDIPDLIAAAIGFAVSAIPEGLPALVTITLALGVQQMARRNAIVRRLPAVETLGAVTRICSDKTGTLTTNEMTVRSVVTPQATYATTGLGYAPQGEVTLDGRPVQLADHQDLAALARAVGIGTDAHVVADEYGQWSLVGEPTEGALRTLALKAGLDASTYPRLVQLPFDSEHKYSASLNQAPDGSLGIYVVGAPDRLLDRCATQFGGAALPRTWWDEQIGELSAQGLRVIGAAFAPARPGTTTLEHEDLVGLCFAGLAAIVDPPRPEAIVAIATCHTAGIGVTMITGDHAGTAHAIANEMGIVSHDDPEGIAVVTGAELQAAKDQQLRHLVGHAQVFARTSPEHKLRLVKALQANGEVVAMTGDGVNDAPALKRSNVGVAMGIKGTEATKQAADIVLADDNFATIEYAIEEGRRIHDNLHKSVLFLLPTNGAQALVVLAAVVFGFTLPLAPVQILWVNMVTAVTLSLALAYEPAEPDIMTRPPRPPGAPLVSPKDLPRIAFASLAIAAATLGSFALARAWGADVATGQTWAVNTLALGQAAYLFNSRFLRESALRREAVVGNRTAWVVVGILLVLQVIFAYVPIMHLWFKSAGISILGWAIPLGFSLVIFLIMEVVKRALRRYETG